MTVDAIQVSERRALLGRKANSECTSGAQECGNLGSPFTDLNQLPFLRGISCQERTARRCQWKSPQNVRAFTIIEVMVAIMIFGGVLAALYSTWTLVVRGNQTAMKLAAEGQRARMAIRTIEDALISAEMSLSPQNVHLYSLQVDTSGNFAALSLVGRLSDSFPGSGYFEGERLRRVSFVVDANRELLLLQNSPYLAEADQDRGVYPLVLARDVTGFQLEFWDRRFTRGEWVEKWLLTNQLPQLVRVTLGLGQSVRKGRQPEQLISRVVALPATGGLQ